MQKELWTSYANLHIEISRNGGNMQSSPAEFWNGSLMTDYDTSS